MEKRISLQKVNGYDTRRKGDFMASLSKRMLSSGMIAWLVLLVAGSFFLHPLRKKLKFGIDLVGGTYITLRVQTDKAIETELKDLYKEIDAELRQQESALPKNFGITKHELKLSFDSYEQAQLAFQQINSLLQDVTAHVQGSDITIQLTQKREAAVRKWAVESDIEVLRTRLNSIGVEEIKVAPQGETDIIVELPDVTDFNKAKEIIGKPANLEFKLVEMTAPTKDEIKDRFGGVIPSGYELLSLAEKGDRKMYVLVEDYAEVSGKHLKDVRPTVQQTQTGTEAVVAFTLTSQGGKKFGQLTADNIGKQLAIILDGKVISAPVIRQAITGGSGTISGSFTIESAKELATMLKSGAFVAPVTFEEERSVGPSLGQAAIKSGVIACLVGLGLLFMFSVIVYKLSGFMAFLALLYNLFLLIFSMYLLKATLTLPGIAGMVLTIGMAIDSSILIYERIRELLAHGEPIASAVNKGFKGALGVILDANITTFLTGLVLFYFGTGPVKGFAVTLMIGIFATLIAGLFFLKSLFSAFLVKSGIQKLSI